jgi:ankyrin repeat protein
MSSSTKSHHHHNSHHTGGGVQNHTTSNAPAVSHFSGLPPKEEIIHSIQIGNLDLLKKYITSDNVNLKDRSGYTLLHIATNTEKNEIAKWLVGKGADVNLHCNGHTVTSLALSKGNFELFDFYIKNNGDCKGRNQLNLLHEAANKNRIDIVETLIEKGADPNQLNNIHNTPLTIAVNHKNKEICQLLLENGACVNIPDKKGNTALHLACNMGDADLISVLVDNTECDFRLKNANEETALDLLWSSSIKDAMPNNGPLIEKFIGNGALFSTPWNLVLNVNNHASFIKYMSLLCKHKLSDLFAAEKPTYNELIINGYWRNALIVAIKSVIMECKSFNKSEQMDMYKCIEKIVLSNELQLSETDVCSTFYMYDDVDEYGLYKLLKTLFSAPFPLKILCRMIIRKNIYKLDKDTVAELRPLTDELKNFLLFENENESRKSKASGKT